MRVLCPVSSALLLSGVGQGYLAPLSSITRFWPRTRWGNGHKNHNRSPQASHRKSPGQSVTAHRSK